ncbi:hypothetical protein Nmel_013550 [Mimus melanotis]
MSAESPEPASAEEQKEMEDKVLSPEKAEEAKLKARYPHLGQKPGGSDFLRKRLQKGALPMHAMIPSCSMYFQI